MDVSILWQSDLRVNYLVHKHSVSIPDLSR